jgi:hypothetical protein
MNLCGVEDAFSLAFRHSRYPFLLRNQTFQAFPGLYRNAGTISI